MVDWAQVHAESDSLALLYQAADGVADASLGINVAKMVGMDKKVGWPGLEDYYRGWEVSSGALQDLSDSQNVKLTETFLWAKWIFARISMAF